MLWTVTVESDALNEGRCAVEQPTEKEKATDTKKPRDELRNHPPLTGPLSRMCQADENSDKLHGEQFGSHRKPIRTQPNTIMTERLNSVIGHSS